MIDSAAATRGLIFFDANARLRPTRESVKKFPPPPQGRRGGDARVPNSRGRGRVRAGKDKPVEEVLPEDDGNRVGVKEDDMPEDQGRSIWWEKGSPPKGRQVRGLEEEGEAIVEPREAQQTRGTRSLDVGGLARRRRGPASWDDGNGEPGISGGVGAGFR
ncbi:hypothetical protein NL676_000672 [Syzygium grande]|nr:hypothetical protein NL676_000672 [Syzygium grande]